MLKPFHSLYDDTVHASGEIRPCRYVGFDNAEISGRGDKVLGVAKYMAHSGDDLAVTLIGTASVEAGEAISRGQTLISDDQGRAVAATGASQEHICGYALNSAGSAGQFIEVLIR